MVTDLLRIFKESQGQRHREPHRFSTDRNLKNMHQQPSPDTQQAFDFWWRAHAKVQVAERRALESSRGLTQSNADEIADLRFESKKLLVAMLCDIDRRVQARDV